MMTKVLFFYLSVVLLIKCSAAEDTTELPITTTTADLITTTRSPIVEVTTAETTTAAAVTTGSPPSETPSSTTTVTALATDTTLKPIIRKTHKRRKASKAAIKKYTELLDFTIAEVVSIADLTLNVTKQIFKDIISAVSSYEDGHNDLVNEKIAVLNAFIAEANEVQQTNDTLGKLNLVEELDSIMEKFNETKACDATTMADQACAVSVLFYGAFKQHSWDSLETQIEQRNLLFLENFKNAADKFWNSLSPKDQKRGRLFHEWLTEFKSTDDADTKFDYLWRWFDV